MRYSLLSRFRGALLGAALGANQGASAPPPGRVGHSRLNLELSRHSSWAGMAAASAESLIRCGGFDVEDWHQSCVMAWQPDATRGEAELTPVAALMAILPLVLFYHEEDLIWPEHLWQASSLLSPLGGCSWELWAFGYAIAQSLQEKLQPAIAIVNIQKMAKIVSSPPAGQDGAPPVAAAKLADLLAEKASLEMAVTELTGLSGERPGSQSPNGAFALALYCFLSTPEDFGLSVVSPMRIASHRELTGAIAGALSGAYNGIAGIPMSWQMCEPQRHRGCLDSSMSFMPLSISPIPPPTASVSFLPLASRLFAAWAGIYDLNRQNIDRADWSKVMSHLSFVPGDK
ncbi:ADP-ribosylglycohydrolase family protein [[Phormidium] sp. ETS-05]|uniref:ADP-ribosylglycohydrolase family protein n=1 Tax=[Phormidium] sp. ETS-05 TaxID=222819 RepID=UPI0018EECDF9|nr:ADP-ribosylglycohydrolase family protein [[Phormidium] sp. ETS-05]